MIELVVDAEGLARSRFAISPLQEVTSTLLPWGACPAQDVDPWIARARRVLRRARLPLLSELALDGGGYVPDFLSPLPDGPSASVEEELELVRDTPPGRVLDELEALRTGRPASGLAGAHLPPEVRRAMARGGAHVARRIAEELRRYWDLAFAPYWETARATLEAEIDRCAGVLARRGAAELFNSLHPGIVWSGGALRVDSRFAVRQTVRLVIVVPSLVAAWPAVAVDPVCGALRPPMMVYPVRDRAGAEVPPSAELARLLGPTRAGLLSALVRPASTTQLAARHFLSPATVSYHLGVLHEAGLVSRARSGRAVLYRRTPAGSRLATARQRPRHEPKGDPVAGSPFG